MVKNYAFCAQLLAYLIFKKNSKEKSILVYTMGKVGSATVANSLKNQLQEYSVYHVHWLNKKNLAADKRFHKKYHRRNKKKGINVNILPKYISRGLYLNKKINVGSIFKVVTLTRDPVAKEISSFFQNAKRFFGFDFKKVIAKRNEEEISRELIKIFLKEYITQNRVNFIEANPLTWFDEELREVFNLDIYQTHFPKNKGYTIYWNKNASVLLIRLEDLNKCFSEACRNFLDARVEIEELSNIGDNKIYASVYQKFKNKIVLPDWYLNKMYNSKYARHFYTENEIFSFREKWEKNAIGKEKVSSLTKQNHLN